MQELLSLEDIFNKRIFRIPDYQRGYAWGMKQLIDFWDDIISLSDNRSHYTGVISIKAVPVEAYGNWGEDKWIIEKRKYTPYYVVDGQQRLTTVSIFLQCLVEIIEKLPKNQDQTTEELVVGSYYLKDIKENFVSVTMPPHNIVKTYKFGYEVDNPSFTFLRHKIFNEKGGGNIEETFYTLNLENAKSFFKRNIQDLIENEDTEAIELLYEKVTQRLMFNLYEIDDNFDVFVAFETMNNRGKKLSDLELLKNRLIYLTTLYSESEVPEEEKNETRNSINDAWRTIYYQLGRNKNHPLNDDDFLRAHWIMYFKFSRQKGNDYIRYLLDEEFNPKKVLEKVEINLSEVQEVSETYDQDLDEDDEMILIEDQSLLSQSKKPISDIHDYVKSLKEAAMHWYNSFFPQDNNDLSKKEQIFMDRINRLGISYFRPLIMTLFLKTSKSDSERTELLSAIERFIFLGFKVSRAASNFKSSLFNNTTRELYFFNGESGDKKIGKSISDIVALLNENLSWVFNSDGSFDYTHFKTFISKKFSSYGTGFYGWYDLRYFLFEYEEKLKETRNQPKIKWINFIRNDKDKISIEHIYPQTADDSYWIERFGSYSEDERKLLNGSIGNLLPLSSSINSSLQNDDFPSKKSDKIDDNGNVTRNGYSDGSFSELEVAKNDEWTPNEIKTRGLKLLSFMEKRWNIKFRSKSDKLDLLHLDFLSDKGSTP